MDAKKIIITNLALAFQTPELRHFFNRRTYEMISIPDPMGADNKELERELEDTAIDSDLIEITTNCEADQMALCNGFVKTLQSEKSHYELHQALSKDLSPVSFDTLVSRNIRFSSKWRQFKETYYANKATHWLTNKFPDLKL